MSYFEVLTLKNPQYVDLAYSPYISKVFLPFEITNNTNINLYFKIYAKYVNGLDPASFGYTIFSREIGEIKTGSTKISSYLPLTLETSKITTYPATHDITVVIEAYTDSTYTTLLDSASFTQTVVYVNSKEAIIDKVFYDVYNFTYSTDAKGEIDLSVFFTEALESTKITINATTKQYCYTEFDLTTNGTPNYYISVIHKPECNIGCAVITDISYEFTTLSGTYKGTDETGLFEPGKFPLVLTGSDISGKWINTCIHPILPAAETGTMKIQLTFCTGLSGTYFHVDRVCLFHY